MQTDGAMLKRPHLGREAVSSFWRAVRSAPRSVLYPALGSLLYMATTMALLFALGIPDSVDGKAFFLVVAYSGLVVFALVGHMLGGSSDEARRLDHATTASAR